MTYMFLKFYKPKGLKNRKYKVTVQLCKPLKLKYWKAFIIAASQNIDRNTNMPLTWRCTVNVFTEIFRGYFLKAVYFHKIKKRKNTKKSISKV